uniref:Uncharacterized protein n=1 Tax=Meloidogyne enterolobii TaxID=390850 RepID=A0A6V7X9K6_MELEN|nr:unnamed protein product [Meloidogyne enterolobii]
MLYFLEQYCGKNPIEITTFYSYIFQFYLLYLEKRNYRNRVRLKRGTSFEFTWRDKLIKMVKKY